MSRICDISGKRANNANRVSFSNKHWARWQYPNLQTKKLYSKELDRYVRVKVATSTLRTIRKLGLDETAKKVRSRRRASPLSCAAPEQRGAFFLPC